MYDECDKKYRKWVKRFLMGPPYFMLPVLNYPFAVRFRYLFDCFGLLFILLGCFGLVARLAIRL